MGSSPSIPVEKHIIIVGGGYAGVAVACALLQKKANFTLIDCREALHHNVGSVRAIVEEDFVRKIWIPYKETFGDHFKQVKVTGIDAENKKVLLANGDHVGYDILIVATGSSGPFPAKCELSVVSKDDAFTLYKNALQKVKASKTIVIVGGGAVGVEIAGEIATEFKDKDVTIVTAADRLVSPRVSEKFLSKVRERLETLKIKHVLGERVTNVEEIMAKGGGPVTIKTDKGRTFEADLALICTGLTVNSEIYETNLVIDNNGKNKTLKVNRCLQVEGVENVFAIGDCSSADERKMAYIAGEEAKVMIENIPRVLHKEPLKEYKPENASFGMGISIGRHAGVAQLAGGLVLPEIIIKKLKSQDLMTGRFWATMKQKMPN